MVERRTDPFITGTSAYDYDRDPRFGNVVEFSSIRKCVPVGSYTLRDGLRDSRNLSKATDIGQTATLILGSTVIVALVLLSFTFGLIILL